MYIYCKDTCETGAILARHIGCEYGLVPPDETYIINYGIKCHSASLNAAFKGNKKTQLIMLADAGICAPTIVNTNPRQLTRDNLNPAWFPCLGRKEFHRKGTDIVWLPNIRAAQRRIARIRTRDFLVEYVPKIREFRVHVLGRRWRSISEKARPDIEKCNPNIRDELIWAVRYGWVHHIMRRDDRLRNEIGSLAVSAARELGFDFGAVDIMLGEDGILYILEINAAPRLNARRVEMYAEYFVRKSMRAQ